MIDLMNDTALPLAYLFAAACFVLALKWLSHPTTARRGVKTGELGMFVAVGKAVSPPPATSSGSRTA